jgi:hypothetical protein
VIVLLSFAVEDSFHGHVAANPVYRAVGGVFFGLRSQRFAPACGDVHRSEALANFPQHVRWINDHSFPPVPFVESGLQTLAAMYGDCIGELERHECSSAASLVANVRVGWYWYMLSTSQKASKGEVMRWILVHVNRANNKQQVSKQCAFRLPSGCSCPRLLHRLEA